MGKRGKREGSIRKRPDGRWEGRVSLGYLEGQMVRPSFYGATRKLVQEQVKRAVGEFDSGIFNPTDTQTVGDFLDRWLDVSVQPTVRPKTYKSYHLLVRLHIKPKLGNYRLQRLTVEQVQRFLNERRESGLSARTVTYLRAVIRRALSQAERWGAVIRNVAALTTPPKATRTEVKPLTIVEAKSFIAAVEGHRLEALWVASLVLGPRQGEMLGLRWTDVNFESQELRISTALQYLDGEFSLVETKTERSRRTLCLPRSIVAQLKRHRVNQAKERLLAGSDWENKWGLVFTTRNGGPLEGSRISRDFKRLLKKACLPSVRFHDLRHTCASLLLAQGESPRVVMEWMGHSQFSLTMNTYAHVMPGAKQDVARNLEQLLA